MAITRTDFAVSAYDFNTSRTVTLAAPPSDGDLIVLFAAVKEISSGDITFPAGFSAPVGLTGLWVATKEAASEASASYSASWTSGADCNLGAAVYSGVDAAIDDATPVPYAQGFASPWPDMEAPSITTVTDGAVHIAVGTGDDNVTEATPGGYDGFIAAQRLLVADATISPAGATGLVVIGSCGFGINMLSVALRPASGVTYNDGRWGMDAAIA